MSTGSLEPEDVYEDVLELLTQLNATELVSSIRRTVARGTVSVEGERSSGKSLSEMPGDQRLAVALELIVSVAEVPLMVEEVRSAFETEEVLWIPEETSVGLDRQSAPSLDTEQRERLQIALRKVVDIAAELKLDVPEIA